MKKMNLRWLVSTANLITQVNNYCELIHIYIQLRNQKQNIHKNNAWLFFFYPKQDSHVYSMMLQNQEACLLKGLKIFHKIKYIVHLHLWVPQIISIKYLPEFFPIHHIYRYFEKDKKSSNSYKYLPRPNSFWQNDRKPR